MSEPFDDTTKGAEESRKMREKPGEKGSYYYDDATGYEVYNPAEDEEDETPEDEKDDK